MADSPPIRKFMFDRSFDDAAGRAAPVRDRRPVTLAPEQLDALKKETYDAGFAAGKKAASESQAQHLNVTVDQIAAHIARLFEQTEAGRQQQESRMREAVLAIARKVLPEFNRRHGLAEIDAMVAGIVGEMSGEPRLVVRVNEGQFDMIDANLKVVAEKQGYTGKIVLLGDAEIRADDCRIEWADGGAERNLEVLWKNVGRAVVPEAEPGHPSLSDNAAKEIIHG